jgi:hypothetical protein
VGRLVAACEAAPVVLPIVHTGMERVMPRGSSFPVPGQEVRCGITALLCVHTRHCAGRNKQETNSKATDFARLLEIQLQTTTVATGRTPQHWLSTSAGYQLQQ